MQELLKSWKYNSKKTQMLNTLEKKFKITTTTRKCSRRIFCLVVAFLALIHQVEASNECLATERFPKVIQSALTSIDTHASAVTWHESVNSIIVGGHISISDLLPEDPIDKSYNNGAAHIGSIELFYNKWQWSKVMIEKWAQSGRLAVTALAVDPQGARVAVYAKGSKNYIFALDLTSGDRTLPIAVFGIQSSPEFLLNSKSFLMYDDGTVLLAYAQKKDISGINEAQKMRLMLYDTITNLLSYAMESDGFEGHSSALARSQDSDSVYIGGGFLNQQKGTWQLALMQLKNRRQMLQDSFYEVLSLGYDSSIGEDCNSSAGAYLQAASAPHISHMAMSKDQLFGLAQVEQCDEQIIGACGVVWRVEIGADGAFLPESYSSKSIQGIFGQFIGMRDAMELDESSRHWVHAIIDSSEREAASYFKISPDTVNGALRWQFGPKNTISHKIEAVFAGTYRRENGAFQAYVAGQLR